MMWERSDYWQGGVGVGGCLVLLGVLLVVVAVVLLVVYLVRQPAHASGAGAAQSLSAPPLASETPREILQRRYANGEIDREDYLQRLSDIGG